MHPGEDWNAYFHLHQGRPPRPEFLATLERTSSGPPARAIDLGAGDGTESRHLLSLGWDVLAVDATEGLRDRLLHGVPERAHHRLTTQESLFSEVTRLPSASFVYAGMALPFCTGPELTHILAVVAESLTPGGLFAAHFLGERDSWATRPGVTALSEPDLASALLDFTVVDHIRREFDGPSGAGPKHWHIHFITAGLDVPS